MARYARSSIIDIAELAYRYPFMWFQLYYDMELNRIEQEQEDLGGKGEWRKPGETIADAHRRIREEREEAKRALAERLGTAVVHD